MTKVSSKIKSTATTPRPSVTFCDDSLTKIQEFEKIEGVDRPLVWWTAVDFAQFRSACQLVMTDHSKQADLQESATEQEQHRNEKQHDCGSQDFLRGLENWDCKARRQRRDRIRKAVWLVLDAQESNFEEGITDGFACADMYLQYTNSTCIQAHVRGLQDEEAVTRELVEQEELDLVRETEHDKSFRMKRRLSSHGVKRSSLSSFGTSFKTVTRRIGSHDLSSPPRY